MGGIMISYLSRANVYKNLFSLIIIWMAGTIPGASSDLNAIFISQQNHTISSDFEIYDATTNSLDCHALCLNNIACVALSYDRDTSVCTLGSDTKSSQAGIASAVETIVLKLIDAGQASCSIAGIWTASIDECALKHRIGSLEVPVTKFSYNSIDGLCVPFWPDNPRSELNCSDLTVSELYSLTTLPQEQNLPTQYPSTNIVNIDAAPVRRDVLSKENAFDGNIGTAYSAHDFEPVENPWISGEFMDTVMLAGAVYTSRQDAGYGWRTENLYLLAALDKADIDDMTLSLCSRFPGPRIEDKGILLLPCSVRLALHFKLIMFGAPILSVGELEFYVY